MGLACRQFRAFDLDALEAALGVSPGWHVLTMTAIGVAATAAPGGRERRSLIDLRASDRAGMSIAVVPVRSDRAQARVALFLSRATVCDTLMLCFFARSHGLTHSEEQVLAILCEGCSAPEIARQLQVAVSTVRSHVRSLCAKTHCNSVRALVATSES